MTRRNEAATARRHEGPRQGAEARRRSRPSRRAASMTSGVAGPCARSTLGFALTFAFPPASGRSARATDRCGLRRFALAVLVEQFAHARSALAAARGHAQFGAKPRHRRRSLADARADLAVGNGATDADDHGDKLPREARKRWTTTQNRKGRKTTKGSMTRMLRIKITETRLSKQVPRKASWPESTVSRLPAPKLPASTLPESRPPMSR